MGKPLPAGAPILGTARRPPWIRGKETAAYLDCDVTTVQRWEKRGAMPIHRHLHDTMGSVYASRAELDAWSRSRNLRAAQENAIDGPPTPPEPPPQSAKSTFLSRWKLVVLLAAAGATLANLGTGGDVSGSTCF